MDAKEACDIVNKAGLKEVLAFIEYAANNGHKYLEANEYLRNLEVTYSLGKKWWLSRTGLYDIFQRNPKLLELLRELGYKVEEVEMAETVDQQEVIEVIEEKDVKGWFCTTKKQEKVCKIKEYPETFKLKKVVISWCCDSSKTSA